MKVLNSSTIQKNIKVNKMLVSFPPGISEHQNSHIIYNYVSSNKDLSIYIEDNLKTPEKIAPQIIIEEAAPEVISERKKVYNKKQNKYKMDLLEESDN